MGFSVPRESRHLPDSVKTPCVILHVMSLTLVNDHLERVRRERPSDQELSYQAVDLAADLLIEAKGRQKISEKLQARQLARMMNDPAGKALTFAMADQVFRPPTEARSAAQFRYLIEQYGVPTYLSLPAQVAMRLGSIASAVAPEVVMPLITAKMRSESDAVILPSEEERLRPHLQKRREMGMRMNLNQLGEAILGEEEAEHRLKANLERLASPDCDYISVKISAVFSQIHLVAYDETLKRIKDRLRILYRAAIEHPIKRMDGTTGPKFVNLDMEEYRDLPLTCAAFQQVLNEPEFLKLEAGIVLQAYLPDSWPVQKTLNAWARDRVANGGATIKIRIVKGANLAMEKVESTLHDWPQAPYTCKADVDANFKRMLHEGCKPESAKAVRLGVASHNLFDIAYAMLLRAREGVEDRVEFEMLEGMANHQARTVNEAADGLLLYAPVVKREDFHSAIAYLVRRLDENTSEENFLHDLFGMEPGDSSWEKQKARFIDACERKDLVQAGPSRVQDQRKQDRKPLAFDAPFHNEADTDWALPHNSQWARSKVNELKKETIPAIPLQIGGQIQQGTSFTDGRDPSRPGVTPYQYGLADAEQVEQALRAAVDARNTWANKSIEERATVLRGAAASLANGRGDAIATMVLDGGKSVVEADAEISEAIDFANYYANSLSWSGLQDGSTFQPLGTVVVTPPWNFPFAIPCGGVLAALMAGNTVILKPAPESVLTAWIMVNQLWEGGVPREALQFVACPDNEIGRSLVTDERVGAVILTGAYETARMFLDWKPEMRLFAETSGKNSLIITAAADPDQAVKDLVRSAFGHAGQKCSAASLAILEGEVYDNEGFRRQLRDAAASLIVGSSWNFDSTLTPIIREPNDALLRALTTLDDGEEWLLEPMMVDNNPCLWTPGIKLGVSPQGWFRRNECFGPVLGLIRANNLEHAINIQNDSEFGLTGGIHSLDQREIAQWRNRVEVGNAYINRPITGAIVQRQPFGGWKKSCFGPGAKAGGPNYVLQFGTWSDSGMPHAHAQTSVHTNAILSELCTTLPQDEKTLRAAAGSDAYWFRKEFSVEHDPSALFCESNVFRYRPVTRALIRVTSAMTDRDLARVILAASTAGVPLDLSLDRSRPWLRALSEVTSWTESDEAIERRIASGTTGYGLLRAPGAPASLKSAAIQAGIRLVDAPVVSNGRLELLPFFREQAISETLHRYGNVVPQPQHLLQK